MRAVVSRLAIAYRLEPYYQEANLLFVHANLRDPTDPPPPARTLIELSQEPRMCEVSTNSKDGLKTLSPPIGVQRFEDDLRNSPCIPATPARVPCMLNAKRTPNELLIHALAPRT